MTTPTGKTLTSPIFAATSAVESTHKQPWTPSSSASSSTISSSSSTNTDHDRILLAAAAVLLEYELAKGCDVSTAASSTPTLPPTSATNGVALTAAVLARAPGFATGAAERFAAWAADVCAAAAGVAEKKSADSTARVNKKTAARKSATANKTAASENGKRVQAPATPAAASERARRVTKAPERYGEWV
ncbi:hypothetical protein EDC01DRAFT_776381 [Geopyxis carbonaria]|nr:hypothetical protein EDC01DRAFT_776381 [Geopyxis carbonaria]